MCKCEDDYNSSIMNKLIFDFYKSLYRYFMAYHIYTFYVFGGVVVSVLVSSVR